MERTAKPARRTAKRAVPQEPAPAVTTEDVPLEAIHLEGDTKARVAINGHIVSEYAEAMTEGVKFPAVTLFRDAEGYWIGDGHHRCRAAKQVGYETVKAEVREGGEREAFLYACEANLTHGLRPDDVDKRHALWCLLMDEEWAKWSDRELGRRCGLDHKTVAKRRGELTGDFPSERRYVTKHGTVATMDTSRIGAREAPPVPANGEAAVETPLETGPATSVPAAPTHVEGGANGHPPTRAAGRGPDPLAEIDSELRNLCGNFDSDGLGADVRRTWSPEDWQRFDERLDTIEALCQQLRTKSLALRATAPAPQAR
jgi:hypothetical protein